MKKISIIKLFLFIFFYSSLSAQNYISIGANVDLVFNSDEKIRNEIGFIIPKPGIFIGADIFNENKKIGFHFDGNIICSHTEESLCLGFCSLLAPSFLLPFKEENGFIISPGLQYGFLLGGTTDKNINKETTLGLAYLGLGTNIRYFFKSGLAIGFNLNYYPLMFIHYSINDNNITKKLEKNENAFCVGISIGYIDFF